MKLTVVKRTSVDPQLSGGPDQEICDSPGVTPNFPSRLSSPRVSTAQVFHLVIYQVRTPEIGLSLPDGLWSWVGATAILLGVYKRSSTTSRTPTTFDHPDYCSVFRSFEKGAFDGDERRSCHNASSEGRRSWAAARIVSICRWKRTRR